MNGTGSMNNPVSTTRVSTPLPLPISRRPPHRSAWTPGGAGSYAANFVVFGDLSGSLPNPQGYARMPTSFPKGTSNTIVVAERYATCGTNTNAWDYWNGFRDDSPGFCMTGLQRFTGQDQFTGPSSMFQTRPTSPPAGYPATDCDWRRPDLPQQRHECRPGRRQRRLLSRTLNPNTWWIAVQPNTTATMPSDW